MTDPQTPGLTEEQIAEMERDADAMVYDSPEATALAPHVRALAAEVRRLQAKNKQQADRIRVNSSALMHAKNTNSRERCELVEARAECEMLTKEIIERNHLIAELTENGIDLVLDARDEARAALARAVELLRLCADDKTGGANWHDVRAFLAEHDRSGK
jgi:hypothetical protein